MPFSSCHFTSIGKYSVLFLYDIGDGKQHEDKFCTAKYCRNALSKPYEVSPMYTRFAT